MPDNVLLIIMIALILEAVVGSFYAIRSNNLLHSALWLASVSSTLALAFYLLGAHFIGVIELSVGAGLVTILFVFAIGISAGEKALEVKAIVPKPLAWALIVIAFGILLWLIMPIETMLPVVAEKGIREVLWDNRGIDVILQIIFIYSGVLGLLGLLSDKDVTRHFKIGERQ
ncbi:MAG: NADH-quinone oxidoreductase subunit J [Anaerolineales bacterium]|nr:NADH-quinone oxidoreductase subunit J [Anaerolineales bacterium]